MFSLGRKKPTRLPFSTDIHCHILPGLDDGSPSLEESLDMAAVMEKAGIRHIYATPHIKSDIFPNDRATIEKAAGEFSASLSERNIGIKINFAAEYFIDMFFLERLDAGEPLLTLDGKHILVESSMQREPMFLFDVLFRLQAKGYRPIMAHPERYVYYGKDLKSFRNLRKAGCLLQLNLLSLGGHYGPQAQAIAQMLVKNGMADLVGTDLHSAKYAEKLLDKRVVASATGIEPANDSLFGA